MYLSSEALIAIDSSFPWVKNNSTPSVTDIAEKLSFSVRFCTLASLITASFWAYTCRLSKTIRDKNICFMVIIFSDTHWKDDLLHIHRNNFQLPYLCGLKIFFII